MRRLIWTAYLAMLAEGYLVYAVGYIVPFLRRDLHVEPWLAAVPSSAMAVGLGLGGAVARRLNARLGPQRAIRGWLLVMATSGAMLATPVSIFVTTLGGFLFGTSLGGWLVHVNSAIGQGPRGSLLLTRANLASTVGGLVGPIVLSVTAASIGWWYGTLVPVPLVIALAFVIPGSPARDAIVPTGTTEPPLTRQFWLAWAFLTLSIGVEFSFVLWGQQVVAYRTGLSTEGATGLASLFLAGMVGGRLLASLVHVATSRTLLVLRVGTAVAALGALIVGLAQSPQLAGIGLFLGGLGIAAAYPFGASLALAHAPGAPVRASARLTLASSSSIVAAPLLLGLVVGVSGILSAWAIVLMLLAAAIVLVLRVSVPAIPIDRAELVLPG